MLRPEEVTPPPKKSKLAHEDTEDTRYQFPINYSQYRSQRYDNKNCFDCNINVMILYNPQNIGHISISVDIYNIKPGICHPFQLWKIEKVIKRLKHFLKRNMKTRHNDNYPSYKETELQWLLILLKKQLKKINCNQLKQTIKGTICPIEFCRAFVKTLYSIS